MLQKKRRPSTKKICSRLIPRIIFNFFFHVILFLKVKTEAKKLIDSFKKKDQEASAVLLEKDSRIAELEDKVRNFEHPQETTLAGAPLHRPDACALLEWFEGSVGLSSVERFVDTIDESLSALKEKYETICANLHDTSRQTATDRNGSSKKESPSVTEESAADLISFEKGQGLSQPASTTDLGRDAEQLENQLKESHRQVSLLQTELDSIRDVVSRLEEDKSAASSLVSVMHEQVLNFFEEIKPRYADILEKHDRLLLAWKATEQTQSTLQETEQTLLQELQRHREVQAQNEEDAKSFVLQLEQMQAYVHSLMADVAVNFQVVEDKQKQAVGLMQAALEAAQTREATMQIKVQACEKEMHLALDEHVALQAELEDLRASVEADLGDAAARATTLEASLVAAEEALVLTESKLAVCTSAFAEMSEKVAQADRLDSEFHEYQEREHLMRQELQTFRDLFLRQKGEEQHVFKAVQDIQVYANDLLVRLREKLQTVDDAQTSLAVALHTALKDARADAECRSKQCDELQLIATKATEAAGASESARLLLEEELKSIRVSLDSDTGKAAAQLSELQASLSVAERAIAERDAHLKSCTQAIEALTLESKELRASVLNVASSLHSDAKDATIQASTVSASLLASERELADAQEQLASCKAALFEQGERLTALQGSQTGLADAEQRETLLRQELQSCRDELASFAAGRESALCQVEELCALVQSVLGEAGAKFEVVLEKQERMFAAQASALKISKSREEELQVQVQQLEAELRTALQGSAAAEAEQQALREELSVLRSSLETDSGKAASLLVQVSELQTALSAAEHAAGSRDAQLAGAMSALEEKRAVCLAYEAELQDLRARFLAAEEELSASRTRISQLEEISATSSAREKDLADRASELESQMMAIREEQKREMEAIAGETVSYKEKIDELQLSVSTAARSYANVANQLGSVQAAVTNFHSSIVADLGASLMQLSELDCALTDSGRELADAQEQLASCKAALFEQGERLTALQGSQTGLADAEQRETLLRQELQSCRDELASFAAGRESALCQVEELCALVQSVLGEAGAKFEVVLEKQERMFAAQASALKISKSREEELQVQVQQLEAELRTALQGSAAAEAEQQALREELSVLRSSLETDSGKAASLLVQVSELQTALSAAEHAAGSRDAQLAGAMSALEEKRAVCLAYEAELQDLRARFLAAEEELSASRTRISQLEALAAQHADRAGDLEEEVSALKDGPMRAMEACAQREAELEGQLGEARRAAAAAEAARDTAIEELAEVRQMAGNASRLLAEREAELLSKLEATVADAVRAEAAAAAAEAARCEAVAELEALQASLAVNSDRAGGTGEAALRAAMAAEKDALEAGWRAEQAEQADRLAALQAAEARVRELEHTLKQSKEEMVRILQVGQFPSPLNWPERLRVNSACWGRWCGSGRSRRPRRRGRAWRGRRARRGRRRRRGTCWRSGCGRCRSGESGTRSRWPPPQRCSTRQTIAKQSRDSSQPCQQDPLDFEAKHSPAC